MFGEPNNFAIHTHTTDRTPPTRLFLQPAKHARSPHRNLHALTLPTEAEEASDEFFVRLPRYQVRRYTRMA
jgi:hypothetical protein